MTDCCLTPIQQFVSYIMARTSSFSMWWWWGPLCTRPVRWVWFYSASLLNQQSAGRHVAPLWHIILIPSHPVFPLSWPGFERMIYRTRGEYANHNYATDAVSYEKEAVITCMSYLRNCIYIVDCNDPLTHVSMQEWKVTWKDFYKL